MELIMLSILMALAANLDNLGVGIAYGIQKIRVSHWANFIIALISFVATWLSAITGETIKLCLSPTVANLVGALLLFGVGVWVMSQPIVTAIRSNLPIMDIRISRTRIYIGPTELLGYPERADIDSSRNLGHWEAILLGFALSINAIAGGFNAGVIGISCLFESILVGIFSFLTILIGCYFGRRYAAEQLGKYATIISGTLLIVISAHQIFG